MKARPARGLGTTLDEAMQHVVEIPNRSALIAYLQREYDFWKPTEANVTVKPYGYDKRIDWDTHLVCIDGKAALFTDGPCPPDQPIEDT